VTICAPLALAHASNASFDLCHPAITTPQNAQPRRVAIRVKQPNIVYGNVWSRPNHNLPTMASNSLMSEARSKPTNSPNDAKAALTKAPPHYPYQEECSIHDITSPVSYDTCIKQATTSGIHQNALDRESDPLRTHSQSSTQRTTATGGHRRAPRAPGSECQALDSPKRAVRGQGERSEPIRYLAAS
jgi:hypothetical protein